MVSRQTLLDFLLPIFVLVVCTVIIATTGLDISLEQYFYQHGIWVGRVTLPWRFLYHYGVLPAYFFGVVGLLLLMVGFFCRKAREYRRPALFLVLLLALGPGLLVNTVFKGHWGRPRPNQLQLFDGHERMSFREVWEPGEAGLGHSFPSGHASAAFYLVFPYFVLRRRAKRYARLSLALGICYGLLMGLARMAQGGHFPSDVLWAGGMVYLTGLLLCHLLRLDCAPGLLSEEEGGEDEGLTADAPPT